MFNIGGKNDVHLYPTTLFLLPSIMGLEEGLGENKTDVSNMKFNMLREVLMPFITLWFKNMFLNN